MSYDDFEFSRDSGTPIELYEFAQGTERWNYISGADNLIYTSQNYRPLPIQRDRIKQNTDVFKNGMKLSFPIGDPFASQFLGFAPEEITTVVIRRGHWGDPLGEFIVYWKGRILGATANENRIDLNCESIFTSIQRPGLRAKYEYSCRRTLYERGCNVNRESFGVLREIEASSGVVLQVFGLDLYPDGYFTGGMVVAESGTTRFITSHTAQDITLTRPIRSVAVGQDISVYPGCDHLRGTCLTKFNNLDNFGGFPFIPGRNPFDGASLF
jgi:uncharacterized phage protein (TIGR02218 family)